MTEKSSPAAKLAEYLAGSIYAELPLEELVRRAALLRYEAGWVRTAIMRYVNEAFEQDDTAAWFAEGWRSDFMPEPRTSVKELAKRLFELELGHRDISRAYDAVINEMEIHFARPLTVAVGTDENGRPQHWSVMDRDTKRVEYVEWPKP